MYLLYTSIVEPFARRSIITIKLLRFMTTLDCKGKTKKWA